MLKIVKTNYENFYSLWGPWDRLDYAGKLNAKPMIKIGGKPILLHIIENFVNQNINEFVFCLGHKAETIINFFLKENKKFIKILVQKKREIKFNFNNKKIKFTGNLISTGIKSGTGGRIKIAYNKMRLNEDILMTYGDGLANINIKKLIKFHYKKSSTLTTARPNIDTIIKIKKDKIEKFENEK